jgi:putative tricarboxylic transport membrane protein
VKGDRLGAAVIAVLAALYVRQAFTFEGTAVADALGPTAYPILIGILAIVLAALLFTRARPTEAAGSFWSKHGKPLVLAGALLAYIELLDSLGFIISTFIFLSVGHLWLGERSWTRAIGLGAGVCIVLWYVFDRVFELSLPAGLLRGLL